MSGFFYALLFGLLVEKNQRKRRQERTNRKHRDFKVVDERELLIENPLEIKSEKNRRQAESNHRHLELLKENPVEIKK